MNGNANRHSRSDSAPDVHRAILPTSPTRLSDVTSLTQSSTLTRLVPDSKGDASVPDGPDSAAVEALAMAERGRKFSVAMHHQERSRRLVQKSGDCNVAAKNVTKRKRKFLADLFTTMVDLRWRWHIVAFVAVFVVTWTLFATVWLVIAAAHGDIPVTQLDKNNMTVSIVNHDVCIDNVYNFRSALLFSIETQATIG